MYSTIAELTGKQQFRTTCGYEFYQPVITPDFSIDRESPFGDRGQIQFDPTAKSVSYVERRQFEPTVSDAYTFAPADLIANPPANTTLYRRTDAGRTFELSLQAAQLRSFEAEYLRVFRFSSIDVNEKRADRTCAYGVPTIGTDSLPATSTPYASLNVFGRATVMSAGTRRATYSLAESTGTFSVNGAAGTVSFSIQLIGREILANGSLATTTTKLPLITSVSGSVTNTGTPAIKTFAGDIATDGIQLLPKDYSGAFFGPQGREAAFSFRSDPAGISQRFEIVGIVVMRR